MDEMIRAATSLLVLAIDQGTHASRALVFDRHGRTLASGVANIGIAYPQTDWVEQDGNEIVDSVRVAATQVFCPTACRPVMPGERWTCRARRFP